MKLRPLHDNVIVRRNEEETKSAGGIVLPGSATEKPTQGEVIAVGAGRVLDNGSVHPVSVKVGNKVVFSEGYPAPATIKINGEELLVIKETAILAVIA